MADQMNFYFCQACGRRVTEIDVEAGDARNKKLKGVFCSECAVGVSTMDTLPLQGSEAKKLVEEEKARVGEPGQAQTGARNRRASGRTRLPPSSRRANESRRIAPPSTKTSPSQSPLYLLGIVAMSALVALAFFIVSDRSGNSPGDTSRNTRRSKSDMQNKKDLAASTRTPVETPVPDPARSAESVTKAETKLPVAEAIDERPSVTVPDERPDAQADFEALNRRLKAMDAADRDARVAAIEAFLKEHPDSEWAAQAKKLLEQQKAATPDAPGPNNVKEAETSLATCLGRFDEAVKKKDYAGAWDICEGAASDAALKPVLDRVKALEAVGKALLDDEERRKKALEALKDGKPRKFVTRKGSVTGVVEKIEGDVLKVLVKGRVNNQSIEYKRQVRLSDIAPAQRSKLLGLSAPAAPAEWLAHALRQLASGDADAAEASLGKVGDHHLLKHYRGRLESIRKETRDNDAKAFWSKQIASHIARKSLGKPQATAARDALQLFRSVHGRTTFADSVAKEMKELADAVDAVLGPPRKLTLNLGGGVTMDFVLIPAGTFTMGETEVRKTKYNTFCAPQHKVTLTRSYYLSTFEVTQAQYQRVMGENPSTVKAPSLPVSSVTWKQSVRFCVKLSPLAGKPTRLPTEAEWEYACRAGTTTDYHFGNDPADINAFGWCASNSGKRAHPVGEKKPNAIGLYDMHGNVLEWVADEYFKYPATAVTDPRINKPTNPPHVARGGSWNLSAEYCRSAFRMARWGDHGPERKPTPEYGIRVAFHP